MIINSIFRLANQLSSSAFKLHFPVSSSDAFEPDVDLHYHDDTREPVHDVWVHHIYVLDFGNQVQVWGEDDQVVHESLNEDLLRELEFIALIVASVEQNAHHELHGNHSHHRKVDAYLL